MRPERGRQFGVLQLRRLGHEVNHGGVQVFAEVGVVQQLDPFDQSLGEAVLTEDEIRSAEYLGQLIAREL